MTIHYLYIFINLFISTYLFIYFDIMIDYKKVLKINKSINIYF